MPANEPETASSSYKARQAHTTQCAVDNSREPVVRGERQAIPAYHTPPKATVIASPFTPPAASLQRNAITCATSRGSSTRFCG